MQSKLTDIEAEAASCGLKINIPESKATIIHIINRRVFTLQQQYIEDVQSFSSLGSTTTTGGSIGDVSNRITKARQAYGQLNSVWKSYRIFKRTKINIFNRNPLCCTAANFRTQRVAMSIHYRFTIDRRREAFTLALVLKADDVVNVFGEDTITAMKEDEFDINNRLRN
uniref:Uncharacterized protein n=1 Tax=Glossina pallidipes TaxID=7398 RepID=A0A1B0AFI3_GLOPL